MLLIEKDDSFKLFFFGSVVVVVVDVDVVVGVDVVVVVGVDVDVVVGANEVVVDVGKENENIFPVDVDGVVEKADVDVGSKLKEGSFVSLCFLVTNGELVSDEDESLRGILKSKALPENVYGSVL